MGSRTQSVPVAAAAAAASHSAQSVKETHALAECYIIVFFFYSGGEDLARFSFDGAEEICMLGVLAAIGKRANQTAWLQNNALQSTWHKTLVIR